ncbi:MAG: polyphenol oxidase family protein [Candidatus Cloacimonadaceae bacterium]|jgi:YfiH family protein|nr:polyphenol oxidase family protein [Candidatus Cloacimonadota bacterium]MDY0126775.1 polyphenol oxidase family protein [Candidatus Cloacimonadaceae bacterium]MCB5254243.1 polyphenol oxidase family protein [Candidatus Cloacimonadota bacterium]MCK9177524.1 polyphenol oxidase family protein [Candidatus Cloacimonadota bacterium]MCK9242900.1 polyphenol oxidase family protein [Candidatus Cloacimonadota bacterium]
MSNIFLYLGNKDIDYRSLMRDQKNVSIAGKTIAISQMVICEQTHSNHVHICSKEDNGAGFKDHPQISVADGFATNIAEQYLLIRTADCYPVLLYEKNARAIAAVHSGREGSRKNIVGQAVQVLVDHFSCDPANIIAHVGAGICQEHYQVSEELYKAFCDSLDADKFSVCSNKHRHLNLRAVINQQLLRAGLKFINIENIQICSYENPDYFSYRRDQGNNRQINLIGINNE